MTTLLPHRRGLRFDVYRFRYMVFREVAGVMAFVKLFVQWAVGPVDVRPDTARTFGCLFRQRCTFDINYRHPETPLHRQTIPQRHVAGARPDGHIGNSVYSPRHTGGRLAPSARPAGACSFHGVEAIVAYSIFTGA